jgi:hypothetical protein
MTPPESDHWSFNGSDSARLVLPGARSAPGTRVFVGYARPRVNAAAGRIAEIVNGAVTRAQHQTACHLLVDVSASALLLGLVLQVGFPRFMMRPP